MKNLLSTLGSLGLGAGLMYLFDPQTGRRRQAGAREQAARLGTTAEAFVETAGRDLKNRTAGLQAQLKARAEAGPVDDVVLAERVRARLGRLVSHPRAIKVVAHQGRVALSGDVLAREVDDLLEAIARIPGVRQVEDHLRLHEHPGAVPALTGGRSRRSRSDWTPATRLAMGAAGGTLALYGLARRGMLGGLLGLVGLGVSARAAVNTPFDQWVDSAKGRQAGFSDRPPEAQSGHERQRAEEPARRSG